MFDRVLSWLETGWKLEIGNRVEIQASRFNLIALALVIVLLCVR